MNSFYITVLSDSSMVMFSNNTQSEFRAKLARPIELDKANWEMGLVELIIPSQIVNISDPESHFEVVTTDDRLGKEFENQNHRCKRQTQGYAVPICFKPGTYATPFHVLEEIDTAIQTALGTVFEKRRVVFHLKYSTGTKRVKFSSESEKIEIGVKFHPHLALKLGASEKIGIMGGIFPQDPDPFPYGVDLNIGCNHMFIYSDLAEYTMVGDIQAPLLRVVPFQKPDGEDNHTHKEFINVHYVPIGKSKFDEIGINIRGDMGQPVQFVGGKSMVKLHFRKKSRLLL